MKIDFEATRYNLRMIRLSIYSAERGFPESTLRRILSGKYGEHRGDKYYRVIDTLRQDGYLVESEEPVMSEAA